MYNINSLIKRPFFDKIAYIKSNITTSFRIINLEIKILLMSFGICIRTHIQIILKFRNLHCQV